MNRSTNHPPSRIGFGLDSHRFLARFNPTKSLILAGVKLKEKLSIDANSDGDVILHAVFNAISQAIGERSIGFYADDLCLKKKIKDSAEYLCLMMKKMKAQGLQIGNIGITIEAQKPKFESYASKMKKSLVRILGINEADIGFNFTSGEGLTPFGKGLGIQVYCVCLLIKSKVKTQSQKYN